MSQDFIKFMKFPSSDNAVKMADDFSAHALSGEIVQRVRSSNLHFSISETPYSVYMTIRKKFVNNSIVQRTKESKCDNIQLERNFSLLKESFDALSQENACLQSQIHEQEVALNKTEEIVRELEYERSTSKIELCNSLSKNKEKLEEIENQKNVSKKLNDEIARNKIDMNQAKKDLKQKEKEVYTIQNKVDNLEENFKKVKAEKDAKSREIICLKKEIKNLEKKDRKQKPTKEVTKSKSNQKMHQCEICYAECMNETGLKNHMINNHETENNLKFTIVDDKNPFKVLQIACTICDNVFPSYDDLRNHSEIEHEKKDISVLHTLSSIASPRMSAIPSQAKVSALTSVNTATTSTSSESFPAVTSTISPSYSQPSLATSHSDCQEPPIQVPEPTSLSPRSSPSPPASYTPPGTPPRICSEPTNLPSPEHSSSINSEDIIEFAERFNARMEEQTKDLMAVIKESFKLS